MLGLRRKVAHSFGQRLQRINVCLPWSLPPKFFGPVLFRQERGQGNTCEAATGLGQKFTTRGRNHLRFSKIKAEQSIDVGKLVQIQHGATEIRQREHSRTIIRFFVQHGMTLQELA